MPKEYQVVTNPVMPVTCHAWNKDRTKVAVAPNAHHVVIYSFDGSKFTETDRLTEHTQTVTSIDWSPVNDYIVTCAQDRNAYVWTPVKKDGKDTWEPSLVILRINRAATCVKWSPDGKKFAVGSGARVISVCYFEKEQNWWVSKHIKKPIRSTVLSLDWHPDNILLAAGTSGFKTRIFCAAIKGVDSKPSPSSWGAPGKFGNVVAEFSASPAGGGWVHDVSFSASGEQLAYVAHDACVYVADSNNDSQVTRLKTAHLPFNSAQWVRPDAVVVAGHDYVPILFKYAGGAIKEIGELDSREEKTENKAKFAALAKFRNMDSKGTDEGSDVATAVKSTHQNAIGQVALFAGGAGDAGKLSTGGKDGKIVVWDLAEASKLPHIGAF